MTAIPQLIAEAQIRLAGTRDPERYRSAALELYRQALLQTDKAQCDGFVHAGAWFEKIALELENPALAQDFDVDAAARDFRWPPPQQYWQAPDDDRRQYRRFALNDSCFLAVGGQVYASQTINLSLGGACIELPPALHTLESGAACRLTIPRLFFDQPVTVVAREALLLRLRIDDSEERA